MQKYRSLPFLLIIFFFSMVSFVYAGDVAVIVNKDNPVEDISFKDLAALFKQEKQYLDKKKMRLAILEADSTAKKVFLKKIYKTDNEGLKKFWLSKIFAGEIAAPPKAFITENSVKLFVAQVPDAIGFIAAELADDRVKVLKIDGRLPNDNGYALSP